MARLVSEDMECASALEISASGTLREAAEHAGQRWQGVSVKLASGSRELTAGVARGEGDSQSCLICREPADEISDLIALIDRLLDRSREEAIFEPAEPSFELTVRRTREGGFEVFAWLDAGNESTGFYRWDAAGIRFYTTAESLRQFVIELKSEFL